MITIDDSALKVKINKMRKAVIDGAYKAVETGLQYLQNEVAKTVEIVYPPSEELEVLMRGVVVEGVRENNLQPDDIAGTDYSLLSYMPLAEIIRKAPAKMIGFVGNVCWGVASPASFINEKARFTYMRSSGGTFEANPFGGKYIEAVEQGGQWLVLPRLDNRRGVLQPEPRLLARSMIKTVPPKQPYAVTIFSKRKDLSAMAKNIIFSLIKGEGV